MSEDPLVKFASNPEFRSVHLKETEQLRREVFIARIVLKRLRDVSGILDEEISANLPDASNLMRSFIQIKDKSVDQVESELREIIAKKEVIIGETEELLYSHGNHPRYDW